MALLRYMLSFLVKPPKRSDMTDVLYELRPISA